MKGNLLDYPKNKRWRDQTLKPSRLAVGFFKRIKIENVKHLLTKLRKFKQKF